MAVARAWLLPRPPNVITAPELLARASPSRNSSFRGFVPPVPQAALVVPLDVQLAHAQDFAQVCQAVRRAGSLGKADPGETVL